MTNRYTINPQALASADSNSPSAQPNQAKDNFAALVMERLKQDILSGYFKPGEKLRMARLKERYSVGISPLREALSQLLIEQLVIVENQRGFTVHPISKEEMIDIYQTRAHIEQLCIELAIERGSDDWEAGIVAAAHSMSKFHNKLEQDPQEWERRHQAFHTAIASGCESPTLLHVRRSLYEKASRYRNLWLQDNMLQPQVFDDNQKEHDALIEAIINKQTANAKALIKAHLLGPSRLLSQSSSFD